MSKKSLDQTPAKSELTPPQPVEATFPIPKAPTAPKRKGRARKTKEEKQNKLSEDLYGEEFESVGDKLTVLQEEFCQTFTSDDKEFFGNGVQSYIEIYDIDTTKPNWYDTACSAASRLLRNVKVYRRIEQLLTEGGLHDNAVDKHLLFLITQQSDFNAKLGAIREYNKLKARITEKKDITSGGKPITVIQANYGDKNRDRDSLPLQAKGLPAAVPSDDGQRDEAGDTGVASA